MELQQVQKMGKAQKHGSRNLYKRSCRAPTRCLHARCTVPHDAWFHTFFFCCPFLPLPGQQAVGFRKVPKGAPLTE